MNSKDQKIKEAYESHGYKWKEIKQVVSPDGWCNCRLVSKLALSGNQDDSDCGYYVRPKSLQGIENNNGWIKIESEDDLPKETDTYWFMSRFTGKVMKDYFTCDSKVLAFHSAQFKLYSHYQPIEKPNPPIY